MALPQETAKLDPISGYQVPQSTNNFWANLSTWDGWSRWGSRLANSMVVVSTVQDRGSVGYFNIKTSTDVTGNIAYSVYTSNTGAFAGEETVSNISPNTGNIAAFCSRYYAVVANVTEPSGYGVLRTMSVTSINSRFDIQLDDLVLGNLSGNINHKVLPLPRSVSAITNLQVTPHYESAEYVEDGYLQTYHVGTYTRLKTNGGIDANATSMAVESIASFQNSRHIIIMDNEVMAYTGKTADTPWPILNSLERGVDTAAEFGNTTAASHVINTEIQLYDTITFNAPYFSNETTIGTPFVISKDRQAPAITLKSNVGLGVGGTVDVRLSVLPEQYMDSTNLNTR
jgi:hypothetical protein